MFNLVVLIGNVATDVDVRASASGTYVATLRLATNSYAGKADDGSRKEATEFHNVVFFGKQAEFVGNYIKKGRQILVTGQLRTSAWDDAASGTRKYKTEVVADKIEPIGPRPKEEAEAA
jgi:single-strand DNA-binding protein